MVHLKYSRTSTKMVLFRNKLVMQLRINFAIIFYIACCTCFTASNNPSLVLMVFRHGERTPLKFYPTDPHINKTFYPIGIGGLTNKGKLMMHQLGEIIRKEYGSILGAYYTPEKVYVRSTDSVRTIASAQLVMSGIWPTVGVQKWHPSLQWQPVVIYTKPDMEEDLLDFASCESWNLMVKKLPNNPIIYQQYILPNKWLIDYINEHSGLHIENLRGLLNFYSTLKSESEFGLELPEWANKIYPEPLHSAIVVTYEYIASEPKSQHMQPGLLLKEWMDVILSRIGNKLVPPDRKMFIYSAHRGNVGTMITALNVTHPHMPHYGSTFIIELHQKDGQHYVKLRYIRSPLEGKIEDLTLSGCESFCPVKTFIERHQHIIPTLSYQQLCQVEENTRT